ncbi:YdaU family protein [Chromobacterium sp. LK1]|uniref:YdaU family protein n=1 Tax=Chromobacterium sp. LK1 TaxID=1628193 RepID=UPI00069FFB36|nr:YdaU family protein [Chromobacterium sp. LK1]
MNYYEHHLGDYAEATAHLSFVEDAAYSRLIRKYYATETPLPADLRTVQRLVGARSEEERQAVEIVLSEFFTLADDGYHNARCDQEIERFRDKQKKARRSANARWNKDKEQCEDDASAPDTALQPQSKGNANASEPHKPSNANASKKACERIDSGCEGNAHQSPDTNTQSVDCYVSDTRAGIPVPDDFQPARVDVAKAQSSGLDLATEVDRFVAHYQAHRETRADQQAWEAQFRKWMLDQQQFNADRQRVTDAKVRAANRPGADAGRAAAADAIGVGDQYFTTGGSYEAIPS